jgi:pimeloyl-ACP methyl ester carboxylesterase
MPATAGLYYFAHGAEDLTRPPVVLLHGAGGNHLYWPPQVRRLIGERVLAVDLPGHGKSEGVGHHTIEAYASAIVDFVEALKLNKAVLVGHSMGGAIALQAAIQSPERVLALGLVGSGARLIVSPELLHMASDPSKATDAIHIVIENSFAEATSDRLKELAEQRMRESRSSVLYGDFLACDAFDVTAAVGQVSMPTLILFGAEDHMVPVGRGRALRRQLSNARLDVIPNAGHMVMLEQPERVAALLSEFLKSVPYLPGI